ncbi:securin-like [Phyllobates terribilis]|uniref:securin-like n=1 Tax=Phyllobates terribilis TaxID=111132 RepID=UPI003CCB673B
MIIPNRWNSSPDDRGSRIVQGLVRRTLLVCVLYNETWLILIFCLQNLTIMATVICTDQENGEVNAALLSRGRAQLSAAGKSLVKTYQDKVHGSVSCGKTSRKALGNINKQVMTQKNGQPLKGDRKVPKPAPAVIQVSDTSDKTDEQQYPDIEKFVPYNPADFETFDVPEEHKLSHLSLAGVGLIANVNDAKRFASLLSLEPALMDIPALSWVSDAADSLPSFLAMLEEIAVEMPLTD